MRLEHINATYCAKCHTTLRDGIVVPLEKVSKVLAALKYNTHLDTKPSRVKQLEQNQCACKSEDCQGALQVAHLFSVANHSHHPFVHHFHNRVFLCRKHHRRLHRLVDGYDFVVHARREKRSPGNANVLSLTFLAWVMTHIEPRKRLAALRVGMMLEGRTRHRLWMPNTALEVSLYCRWLRGCGLERIQDFKGILFEYKELGYERPGKNGEPGSSRTYSIYPEVIQALRKGTFVDPNESDLRALLAWALESRGKTRDEIAEQIRTSKNTKPNRTTISKWVSRAKQLIQHARDTTEAV